MRTNSIACIAGLAGVLALGACSKGAPTGGGSATNDNPAVAQKAQEMFNARCTPCHGPEGRGDGPASAALTPKPRNYHDKAWQAKVTDDDIKKTITYGGAAVGKSPIMPASPDLDAQPEMVEGLLKIVRAFGKQQ